ncbi:hypothetical protein LC593_30020 [Nostoc sp. CHAB 5844]|nr:hypothetical protein [Nostoc sp. CHAB 5844]
MTTQFYSPLIASSLASGFIAFGYYAPGQIVANFDGQNSHAEITLASTPTDKIQECFKTSLNQMCAYNVQPELMLDSGLPERLVIAASR